MRLPRRSIPSVSGLIAFEATARRLSFSGAAADLALSQGAVSKRVRQLEDQLGISLLNRGGHQISLSDAGKQFLPKVQDILAQIDRTTRELLAGAAGEQVLAVGADPAFAIGWLIPSLAQFNRSWPDLRIDVLSIDSSTASERSFDLIIRRTGPEGTTAAEEIPLFSETVVACVGREATRGQSDATLLETLPLLRHTTTGEPQDLGTEDDTRPETGPIVDHCGVLLSAAVHGHGIALVPGLLVQDDLHNGRLRQIGKRRAAGRYVVSICNEARGTPEAREFRDWLIEAARRPRKPYRAIETGKIALSPGRPQLARKGEIAVGRDGAGRQSIAPDILC